MTALKEKQKIIMQLASQCAPLLLGIKVSNLFIIDKKLCTYMYQLLEDSYLKIELLYENQGKVAFLLYQEQQLIDYIKQESYRQFLEQQGYSQQQLSFIFEQIRKGFRSYWAGRGEFPHELGVLLGYPIWDILGFIEHEGQNSLYIGYWKVYDKVNEAKKIFAEYEKAKQIIITHLLNGGEIQYFLNETAGKEVYHTQEAIAI